MKPLASPHPSRAARLLWPLAGLLGGILLTLTAWILVRQADQARVRDLQAVQSRNMALQMERRMRTMEEVLRGSAGFLGHGPLASRAEFRDYVEGLRLRDLFPGVQGLGFAEHIPPGGLAAHTARLRREGFPDYRVEAGGPLAPAPEGTSAIIYLEPMDARNQRAFGKDMLAEAARREAMARARDTGLMAITAPVTLYQETVTGVQMGTLIYLPVYDRRLPRETVAERRAALRGWAYCPFRMGDLVQAALARDLPSADVELYDGTWADPAGLLFASSPGPFREPVLARSFQVGDRVWTLRVRATQAFFDSAGRRGHWEVLLAGLSLSLALGGVIVLVQGGEARAQRLADERQVALRATEARFGTLFEKAPVGLAIVDSATGRFQSVNPRLGQILGYPVEALMERTFMDMTHPDHVAADVASVAAMAQGAVEGYEKEKRYIHREGHVVWGRIKVVRLPRADGEPLRHLTVVEDISDYRRATEALRENEARFRNLVENAVDAIVLMDAEGRILLTNREASRLTGYTPEEFLGLRIHDLSPDMPMDDYAQVWNSLAFGESRRIEGRTRRKDGSTFPVDIHMGLLTPGEPRQILTMARDMSAREGLAKAELRALKAESLVLMAGGIAHDFNNLFQAIQSNLEIAGFQARGDAALAATLAQARGALGKAVVLSWKMLDFAGRGTLRVAPLDLRELLSDLLGQAPDVALDLRPAPPVLADAAKLRQVVEALVDNAREAAPGGVRIRVGILPGAAGGGPGAWPVPHPGVPAVCLEVADNGPGVPEERLALICDPFYTTREPGRGLGLPAAVGILTAHRAGMQLVNGEGGGLVVRLYLRQA